MRPVADRSADLDRLLAQGPFPAALRAAIGESGLSLDRIRHRLARRGLTVSVPTLSLWQSGRRRPERAESLRVLAGLEQLLELPSGSLGGLLGPPRPRGRAPGRNSRLIALSQHDRAEIDEAGRLAAVRVRVVLRAEEAGAQRWPVRWDLEPGVTPKIVADRNCRVGSVEHDLDRSRLTAELVLDAAPAPGESVIVEYRAAFPAGPAARRFVRTFGQPVRDYLLEARFAVLPARCVRLHDFGGPRELSPDSGGTVHVAEADAAGRIGIRWEP
ncbi:hypothetical protein [Amycolatopsis sp. lyj-109]|uniref:hypothetical protein n=1 Tax=Amycolatopsis sp. lyj-109 TaxID=2789287 RepID=UPI00397BEB7C